MIELYIFSVLACIVGALMILQGVGFWWKKDFFRAIFYTGGALFLVLTISTIGVVGAMNNILDEKIQAYGIENTMGAIDKWKNGQRD